MVQWIKICLPVKGTWVWSLVQEDSTCCRATKPVHQADRAQELQIQSLCAAECSIFFGSNEDPVQRKIEKKIKLLKKNLFLKNQFCQVFTDTWSIFKMEKKILILDYRSSSWPIQKCWLFEVHVWTFFIVESYYPNSLETNILDLKKIFCCIFHTCYYVENNVFLIVHWWKVYRAGIYF